MNKNLVIGIIIAVVILGAGAFLFMNNGTDDAATNTVTNTVTNTNAPAAAENSNAATDTSEPALATSPYVGDAFTFLAPQGWIQVPITGTLIAYQDARETYPVGSAEAALGFKSYLGVTSATMEGRTLDELSTLMTDSLKEFEPSTVVFDTDSEEIEGQAARLIAFTMTQQSVDFTMLIAVIVSGETYYQLSYNTTTEKWPEYRDIFYASARSFTLTE